MSQMIQLNGLEGLQARLHQATQEASKKIEQIVFTTALDIRNATVKRIANGPKTGHIYQSKVSNRVHRASDPGQAPATDSGDLITSYTVQQEDSYTYTVSSNLPYAYYLEFGTSKMKARPHLTPSVEENRNIFKRRLTEVFQ